MENGSTLVELLRRQLGIQKNDVGADEAAAEAPNRTATSVVLRNRLVGLSICGEPLSESWRKSLQAQKPSLVLNPAHVSVSLAGNPHRSWEPYVSALLNGLPRGGCPACR